MINLNSSLFNKFTKPRLSTYTNFQESYGKLYLSKNGFVCPIVKFLISAVIDYKQEFLKPLPETFERYEHLIQQVAPLHAELLFILPFREENGRTARLFTNYTALKGGSAWF